MSDLIKDIDALADSFKKNVTVSDRRYRLKTYKQCFLGKEAVDYLVKSGAAPSRADALKVGKALQAANLFRHVTGDHELKDEGLFYRYLTNEERELKEAAKRHETFTSGNLAADFKKNVKTADRTYMMKSYKDCFVGKEAVDYLVNSKAAASRAEAVELGQLLQETSLFEHVTRSHDFKDEGLFYRFLDGADQMDREVTKLRELLLERWINKERLIKFLDSGGDGMISYDSFYDGLSQLGLADSVSLRTVFLYVDTEKKGSVSVEALLEALKLKENESDMKAEAQSEEEDVDLPDFPETLLVGLVAHNNLKPSMMKFVKQNLNFFKRVSLVTTGSTGRSLKALGLEVDRLVSSGPLGGDQEIGGMITKGEVAAVFFFTDPLDSHPHQADIIALNRICCVHDTMFANNPSTAQALIYALEYSAFGFATLTGDNPNQNMDSDIVVNYKERQKKVIAAVQGKNATSKKFGAPSVRSIVTAPKM